VVRLLGIAAAGVMVVATAHADARSDAHSGFAALDKGDYDACVRLYTKALEIGTLDALGKANAHLNRGVCHSRKRQFSESLADSNAAIDLYTPLTAAGHSAHDRAAALQGRGIVYYNLRKLDLAHKDLNAAMALAPADGEIRRNRGDLFRLEEKYTEAVSEYDAALNKNPNDVEALDARGVTRLLQEQPDSALADLNAAIRLSADYADAYAHRASVYYDKKDYAHAIADNTTVINLRPNEGRGYEQRARVYQATKNYLSAAGDYGKLIEIEPDSARFHYYSRGMAYANAGSDNDAIADLTAAINLDPKWYRIYFARADLYLKNGRIDEGLADYNLGFANLPTESENYFNHIGRGRAEFAAGRFKEAAGDFRRAGELMRAQFKHDMSAGELLWLHLAARRAGEDDRADFATQAAKLDRSAWPGPVVSYFLGEAQQDAIWTAAATGGDSEQKFQTCEANFYLGEAAIAEGNIDAAQDFLGVAMSHCASDKTIKVTATAERERLEAKPQ
jgi:tetratricopeptide (TPR) repeat protein